MKFSAGLAMRRKPTVLGAEVLLVAGVFKACSSHYSTVACPATRQKERREVVSYRGLHSERCPRQQSVGRYNGIEVVYHEHLNGDANGALSEEVDRQDPPIMEPGHFECPEG